MTLGDWKSPLCAAAALLAWAAPCAWAQDQTFMLSAPPTTCSMTPPPPGEFDQDSAAKLIKGLTKDKLAADVYYLIHAVSFTGERLTISEQKWFVYHKPWHDATGPLAKFLDARVKDHFEEARVFGSRKLAVVYVLNGVPVITRANAQKAVRDAFDASLTKPDKMASDLALAELQKELQLGLRFPGDKRREAALAQSLKLKASTIDVTTPQDTLLDALGRVMTENLIAKEFDNVTAASTFNLINQKGEALTALTPDLLSTQSFAALADLRYRVDVTKKEPAPLLNLKGLMSVIGQAAPRDLAVKTDTTSICGLAPFSIDPLPADMKITALAKEGQTEAELGKTTYDNERKYWFDFSLALPLKTYDNLSVDVGDGGAVGVKEVKKTDLFAAVNLNPVPYDTKKAYWHWVPGVIYGMPITGKPLKRHLLAVSIGLTRAQLFAGVLFSKNETVTATSDGTVTTAVITPPDKWTRTFTWGINLSVKNVTDLLSKKK